MPTVHVPSGHGPSVAKRMLYLAWQACGRPLGMGVLQDRGPNQTEDQVWKSAVGRDDYQGFGKKDNQEVFADYVQGRMMKISLRWDDASVTCRSGGSAHPWDQDYQGFSGSYPDFQSLVIAACRELGIAEYNIQS